LIKAQRPPADRRPPVRTQIVPQKPVLFRPKYSLNVAVIKRKTITRVAEPIMNKSIPLFSNPFTLATDSLPSERNRGFGRINAEAGLYLLLLDIKYSGGNAGKSTLTFLFMQRNYSGSAGPSAD